MPKRGPVTIDDIQFLAHDLAQRTMSWDEPIPEFNTRFPSILESCIAVPFQRFNNRDAYPGLVSKAAILFYLLIKNHPFQNGNKRIAVTALLTFLYLNDKWVSIDNTELYNFAVWVAESSPKVKKSTVKAIEEFIGKHIIDYQK